MFKRLAEKITSLTAIVSGLISIVLSMVAVFVGGLESIPILRETSQITLALVGLLCLAVGLERFTKFEDTNERLDKLYACFHNIAPTLVVEGHEAIYKAATELINYSEREIRASSFREKHKAAPATYLEAVANKIKQTKVAIEYKLLYGYGDFDSLRETDKQHKAFFLARGIEDHFIYAYLNTPLGIDLLIIDNMHLLLALPTLATDPSLRKGILFLKAPNLVSDVLKWYDSYLWHKASYNVPSG